MYTSRDIWLQTRQKMVFLNHGLGRVSSVTSYEERDAVLHIKIIKKYSHV